MPEVFSPEINWLTPLLEDREYETGIISSHDGVDQRISYIDTPNRRFTYSVSALDEKEAALLEALIRRVQGEECYVPYWRGARYASNITNIAGGKRIFCNTATAGFEVDNWAMLFVDAHTVVVGKVIVIASDHIDTDIATALTWPIGRTKVVPVFLGQLGSATPIDYAAKFAKTVQVAFDIHPVQNEFFGDCNWATHDLYPERGFLFEIEPTAGPTGGPAMKVTIPAGSRIFGSVFPIQRYTRLSGLAPGIYTMEGKVKMDWNLALWTAGLDAFDGRPAFYPATIDPPSIGQGGAVIGAEAFNTWQTYEQARAVGVDGWLVPIIGISEGTTDTVDHHVWFADLVIRDADDNIVWSCLPSVPETVPTDTPIFAPLTALHRPGASLQKVQRAVDTLSSLAGAFAVYPRADVPYTEHDLDLVFFNAEEAYTFQLFFDMVLGAFGAFWLPSYQQDLTPIGTIGSADATFDILHCQYTTLDFPGTQRRQIAFVQPDSSFIKRSITAAVDNGDGTETLTINEPLGFEFAQNNANGICFLWYCRFVDDVESIEWIGDDQATLAVTVVEIADPPDGGSGDSTDGFLSDVP